jgi:hypothetical protein
MSLAIQSVQEVTDCQAAALGPASIFGIGRDFGSALRKRVAGRFVLLLWDLDREGLVPEPGERFLLERNR